IRNRALEQIRAGLYISGTSAQDYLLEQNPAAAESYRGTLQAARNDISKALANYAPALSSGQKASFRSLQAEIQSYWQALEPISHWDAKEKQQRSESFMHQVLRPRRTATLQIADRIGAMNERELKASTEYLSEVFNRFRSRLIVVLAV